VIIAILPHILKDVKKHEINSLITRLIPQRYFEIEGETPEDPWQNDYNQDTQTILEKVYRTIYDNSDKDVKVEMAKEFTRVIKEEAEYYVIKYGDAFFKARDMAHLSANDIALVKAHIFSRLEGSIETTFLDTLEGIFQFVDKGEIVKVFDLFVRNVVRGGEIGDRCARILSDAAVAVPSEIYAAMDRRLDQWLASAKKRGVEKTIKNLEKITLLPF